MTNDRAETTPVPQGTGSTDSSHTGSMSAGEYRDREARIDRDPEATEARRREEFGGFNLGADFFGWLVAVAMAVLLASIVGAVAAAVGSSLHVTQTDAQRQAGTFGVATAIALLVVLMIAYYAGGYVAGRMSRYDGGRQGFGVWLIGVVVTIVVVAVGIVFGSKYDIFQRVNLPSVPIPSDTATWGGIITLAAILVGTLLAAFVGGKVGRRYHSKVDRVRS
jgi:amino acid transporter